MAGVWKARGLLLATAALTLPLWLGSCTPGQYPSAGSSLPAGATAVEPTEEPGTPPLPAPRPQAPPPPITASAAAGAEPAPQPPAPSGRATAPEAGGGVTAPGSTSGAPTSPPAAPKPSPTPEVSAPPPADPSGSPSARQPATRAVTAYYVLLEDGGAGGVRFGCNDSLASVRRTVAGIAEPLPAAMAALLDGSAKPAPGMYNALSASTLTFLSGTFDGTTVTVYLAGTLRPGGVCDVPRIEAQLTQTAVASVGAIRAEVYINGVGLTQALSLK